MDDSQSSDLFSEASDNIHDSCTFEIDTYNTLLNKIKTIACIGTKNVSQEQLTITFDDCRSCIFQSLDIISSLLAEPNLQADRLCGCLEDAVCILQTLANFLKIVIESVVMTCSKIKNFSTSTGNILLSVFTHCKNSEYIYGNSLCIVEKQLKDLFKSCHELQLIYLLVLEKNLIFELTEKEDQDILVKTIGINLKIGDVVQSLDVKTMAEQWKAYIVICEKYSNFLLEKNIFNITSKILVSTIENNIIIALEANQDDKIVQRSLKVANFSLKILLRICNIFKYSVHNKYEHIVNLLLNLSLHNSSYHEVTAKKSSEFSLLTSTLLSMSTETLIAALVSEEKFLKIIFLKNMNELKGSQFPGYILLLTMIVKVLLENGNVPSDHKDRIIASVFSFMPYCHKWFNVGLKIKNKTAEGKIQYYGMYEHLLVHTVALSATLNCEQYNELEGHLYEAILGTEYYSALFASNLWVLLCRFNEYDLQLPTLVQLLNVYQKLESNASFSTSPQKIHLSYTIEKLFETLSINNKLEIHKQFSVKYRKNIGVWTALKIRNVNIDPKSMDRTISDLLFRNYNDVTNGTEGSLTNLIKYLELTSTCPFVENNSKMECLILNAWLKVCPICHNVLLTRLDGVSVGLFSYLEALVSLTGCYIEKFERKSSLSKILNIVLNIILTGNTETVYLLFNLFCKLSGLLSDHTSSVVTHFSDSIRNILDKNDQIQDYIFSIIASDDQISKLFGPDVKIKEYVDYKNKLSNFEEWQRKLDLIAESKYVHNCLPVDNVVHDDEIKRSKSTFDIGDIDSLFGDCDSNGPASKKPKYDDNLDKLIAKLETNVEQLGEFKENMQQDEYKGRIQCLCDKLKTIVS